MRGLPGKLLLGMVAAALLVAAAGVGGLLWLDGERLARLASDYFERQGFQLSAQGITRSFGLSPWIEVEGLALREPSYDQPLFEVEHGAVGIALPSLIFGPIELSDIVVERATVVLPFDDGLIFWGRAIGDLLGHLERAGVSIDSFRVNQLTVEARHSAGNSSTTVARIEGRMPQPSALAFELRDLQSSLVANMPAIPDGRLTLNRLSLSHAGNQAQTVRLDGTGRLNEWPLAVIGRSSNPLLGEARARHALDVRLELANSTIELSGSTSRGSERHLTATVKLDYGGFGGGLAWAAQFELSDPGTSWLVEALTASWTGGSLDGQLQIERHQVRPELKGTLKATGMEIGSSGEDTATDRGRSTFAIADMIDGLDVVDAQIDVEMHDSVLYGLDIARIDFPLRLSDARLVIDPLEAELLAGELTAAATVQGAARPPAFELNADLNALSTARLLAEFGIDHDISGRFDGHVRFRSEGNTGRMLLDSAQGNGHLTMNGGHLSETLAQIADQDVAATILRSFGGDDTTPIRCAIVELAGDAGVFETRSLIVDTGEVKLVGDGQIDLGAHRLDLAIRPHAKDFSLLSASAPVHIEGPLDAPRISAETGAVIASLLTPIEIGSTDNAACQALIGSTNAGSESAN